MRGNLVFVGISEEEEEDSEATVKSFMEKHLKIANSEDHLLPLCSPLRREEAQCPPAQTNHGKICSL